MKKTQRFIGFWVWVCFFFSGFSGLIYEVVWTRRFELIFGATTYALGVVLTAFMGGLCAGSWAASRQADRVRKPLKVYGTLEITIGLYAFLFPFLLERVKTAYLTLESSLVLTPAMSLGIRFLGALLVLIIPTGLMGATLPFLARFVTAHSREIGRKVGRLYGINTVGAVLGALFSGFYLLPHLGQSYTLLVAAVINLSLGTFCFLWGWRFQGSGSRAREIKKSDKQLSPEALLALTVLTASGFSAMVYETGYNRVLAMILGGSVYAFSTMLAAFLTGLSVGALALSLWPGALENKTVQKLAWIQAGVGVAVLVTGYLFDRLPYLFMMLVQYSETSGWKMESAQRPIQFFISFLIMLPTALLLGAAFPLALQMGQSRLEVMGRWVGRVYVWNTFGAVVGSFGTAFIFIPQWGIQKALAIGVFVHFLSALLLAAWGLFEKQKVLSPLMVIGPLLLGVFLLPTWNLHLMAIGPYFHAQFFQPGQDFIKSVYFRVHSTDLLFYREGVSTTVTVERYKGTDILILSNNGKTEASSIGDLPTQQLVSHLPLLWREAVVKKPAGRVALVGLASGITAGAALQHSIERLDVIELEPFMIDAARLFKPFNFDVLSDPRFHFIADDARHALSLTPQKYDVIISEPSNPWISGVSNLFTRDFFEIGRGALTPGGVYAQWVQVYGLGLEDLKCILRTFKTVFPNTYVFGIPSIKHGKWPAGDLVLLGSAEPLKPDLVYMEGLLKDEKLKAALNRVEVEQAGDLVSLFRLGPKEVDEMEGEGKLNTDDNAAIEFSAPLSLYRSTYYENLWEVRKFQPDPTAYVDMPASLILKRKLLLRIADDLAYYWRKDWALRLRKRALKL